MTEHGAIRLTGLRKRYGSVQAVDGMDLLVAPGEVVTLLGPNGAGKCVAELAGRLPAPAPDCEGPGSDDLGGWRDRSAGRLVVGHLLDIGASGAAS